MAPDFETFISTAWDEHGDHPQAVADRLAQSIHVVANATHARRFAALRQSGSSRDSLSQSV